MRRTGVWRIRCGFTLIDLLAAIGVLLVLFALVLPAVHRTHEYAWPINCGSNLRQIGQAMLEYANVNGGMYPRTRHDPASAMPTAYTGVAATQPFAPNGPAPNDVTAILYLLIRDQGLLPESLVCPGARSPEPYDFGGAGKGPKDSSNFPSDRYLSYSIHNPYPPAGSTVKASEWANRLKADFAIAADMNSGSLGLLKVTPSSSPKEMSDVNSRNHPRRGQNVLYGDGHVDFVHSVFAGYNQDNIYTYGPPMPDSGPWRVPLSRGIVGPPAHQQDSTLLPVATRNPGTIEPTEFSTFMESGWPAKIAVGGVAFFVLTLWYFFKRFRKAGLEIRPRGMG